MRWAPWTIFAPMAFLPLAGCGDTPPSGVNAAAYQQALLECREEARAVYGIDIPAIGHPRFFAADTSWEVVDPCMQAKGFPPPP